MSLQELVGSVTQSTLAHLDKELQDADDGMKDEVYNRLIVKLEDRLLEDDEDEDDFDDEDDDDDDWNEDDEEE